MRRDQRLKRREDFASVYRHGTPYANGPLVIRVCSNPDTAIPRFGFAVGKRIGGAVVRNRIKRRLRSAVQASDAQGGVDVVVIARARAVRSSYRELETALQELLRRAELVPARHGAS
ncbi:MAG TPA: ribonuclease P protein component [Dehalococcoidia bacterium]|nr:ribonuclease P protein component [Dehalococcoidia bacterium]